MWPDSFATQLGVKRKWSSCNMQVNGKFRADWMHSFKSVRFFFVSLFLCTLRYASLPRPPWVCVYIYIYIYTYMIHGKYEVRRRQEKSSDILHTFVLSTGWRRPIGCLKLQVIFCKRATNYRALLRKMTYKDKPSYASSPPCSVFLRTQMCGTSAAHLVVCVRWLVQWVMSHVWTWAVSHLCQWVMSHTDVDHHTCGMCAIRVLLLHISVWAH